MAANSAENPHRLKVLRLLVSETSRAWFNLTPIEHRAVLLVLGLFLLGLAVRLARLL